LLGRSPSPQPPFAAIRPEELVTARFVSEFRDSQLQMFAGESIDRVDPDSHGQHLGPALYSCLDLDRPSGGGQLIQHKESFPGGSGSMPPPISVDSIAVSAQTWLYRMR